MTYTKPEINLLGDAARVIQILQKPFGSYIEFIDGARDYDPAYEMDE